MIVIPRYIMVLIPVLTVWWTHRRGARREYWLLAASVFMVCISLLVFSHYHDMVCTWYGGPLAATGIMTFQLPLSVFITTVIAAIPTKRKVVRNFIAVLIGEVLLINAWIS